MAVKSYAWSLRLHDAVADGATVDVPTPGFLNPQNYDTASTGVVLDGRVLKDTEVTCAWAGDFSAVTLTNGMGAAWNSAKTLYVTVAGVQIDPGDIQASFDQLAQRVTNCESKDVAQDTRMDNMDGTISGLDARITALEGAVLGAASVNKDAGNHAKYGQYRKEDEDHDEEHSNRGHKKPK